MTEPHPYLNATPEEAARALERLVDYRERPTAENLSAQVARGRVGAVVRGPADWWAIAAVMHDGPHHSTAPARSVDARGCDVLACPDCGATMSVTKRGAPRGGAWWRRCAAGAARP